MIWFWIAVVFASWLVGVVFFIGLIRFASIADEREARRRRRAHAEMTEHYENVVSIWNARLERYERMRNRVS